MTRNGTSGSKARLWLHLIVFVAFAVLFAAIYLGEKPSQEALAAINSYVRTVGQNWWYYAATIGTVSTLAMALLEFLKAILDARRWYHEWSLRRWVRGEAFNDLVFLAIGDDKSLDALCSQPIEKVMGEIQTASNIALDSAEQYPALFQFLTKTDVRKDDGTDRASLDRAAHVQRLLNMNARTSGHERTSSAEGPPDEEARAASKARLRLANLMARKLDAFQLRTQYYWDRGNQLASVLLSIAIIFAALAAYGNFSGGKLILGVISGLIAPFVKDFASNLAQFATKS